MDGYTSATVDMIGKDGAQHAFTELNAFDNPNQLRVTWKRPTLSGGPVRSAPPRLGYGGYGVMPAYPTTAVPNVLPFKVVQCKFFLEGTCTHGAACTFLHGDEAPRYDNEGYAPTASYGMPYSPYPAFNPYGGPAGYGVFPERQKKPHKPEKYKTMPCSNFAKGSCSFGDKCNFVHDQA